MAFLRQIINRDERDYFIEEVNKPLLRLIILYSKRYPEPTLEPNQRGTVTRPNSKWLLEVQAKYLEYEDIGRVAEIIVALIRIVIAKIEHSANYGDRLSWFVEYVPKGWKPRSLNHPQHGWKEPKPYGRQI